MIDPIEAAHFAHGGDTTPKKKSQIIRELREEVDTLRRNHDAEKSWYREFHRTVPELRRRLEKQVAIKVEVIKATEATIADAEKRIAEAEKRADDTDKVVEMMRASHNDPNSCLAREFANQALIIYDKGRKESSCS